MTALGRIAVLAAVFCLGAAVGFAVGTTTSKATAAADEAVEIARYSALMAIQRSAGTDTAYSEALIGYLTMLQRHQAAPSGLFSEKIYAVDSALTYARLSALANKAGNTTLANEYLGKAAALCPQLGWKECSTQAILGFAQQVDRNGLFGQGQQK